MPEEPAVFASANESEPPIGEEKGASTYDPGDAAPDIDPDTCETLRAEWGADFETNMALARDAAMAIDDDALVELLEESGLGNDPRIIRAAARIGQLLQNGGLRFSPSRDTGDPEELEDMLDELSRRPDYWSDRVQRRVREIHLALHGGDPIGVYRAVDGGDSG